LSIDPGRVLVSPPHLASKLDRHSRRRNLSRCAAPLACGAPVRDRYSIDFSIVEINSFTGVAAKPLVMVTNS